MGIPEGIAPATTDENVDWEAEAKKAEQRRRDTQAAYTKSQQELAATRAQLKVMKDIGGPTLDQGKLAELEDLKFSDPDAWYKAKLALESEAHNSFQSKLAEASESEVRLAKLEEFKATHPGFELTDDDIPPRIAKKLASGQVSFDEFLQETYDYLVTPKVIGDANKTLEQPNLGKVGGGITPSAAATSKDIVSSYKNEVY